jgi:alpha-1,3-glucosyltransferase
VSQWVLLPLILMAVGLFRWVTGFWQYSGYQMPPMHGDFEAQRHWMELTVHLPITHWYYHDLQWWGLDYPPLTAYHSWILGMIGTYIQPDWFALYLSRRSDDPGLKVFMRATVILSEFAIFIPAAVLCIRQLARLHNINSWESAIALTALLMQPATILIDHGHFQYNTVMLGFQLASIASMLAGRSLWSCVFFVCALGFKQMALFYAPAVAAYLAGSCLFLRINIARFIGMAIITVASFAALFLPLILGTAFDVYRDIQLPIDAQTPPLLAALPFDIPSSAWYRPYVVQLLQATHRIFPFARGLFEDKVANVWCAIHASGLHKLTSYDQSLLSRASLLLTLAAITPPCAVIFFRPQKHLIPLAFSATAWAFFLCGFQVHEKNVLLPLLPMTLLLGTAEGMKPAIRAWVGYGNLVACFTMFPLLTRDGLRIPYAVLTLLWAYLLALPPFSLSAYTASASDGGPHWTSKLLHLGTYAAMLGWHGVVAFKDPPQDKPDLWVVANVLVGAAGFGCCYLWCLWRLVADSGYPGAFERRAREVERKTQ